MAVICFAVAVFALGFGAWRAIHLFNPDREGFGSFMVLVFNVGGVLAGAGGAILFSFLGILAVSKGESAWIENGRLFHSYRFWRFRFVRAFDLVKIRNVRAAVPPRTSQDHTVYFDYGGREVEIGNNMLRRDADETMFAIIGAAEKARSASGTSVLEPTPATPVARVARPVPRPLNPVSALALVAANLVPIGGVLFLGWDLAEVMVLFWAESAVIGFYHLLKMAKLGGPLVLVFGPIFISHFGAFMAGHFYFIYLIFFGGMKAKGPEVESIGALLRNLVPLWPAVLTYFISHGISYWTNFLRRREYEGRDLKSYMGAPYRRIIMMHLAIIGGFWVTILLGSGVGFLVALVLLKTGFDLHGHARERTRATGPATAPANPAPALRTS